MTRRTVRALLAAGAVALPALAAGPALAAPTITAPYLSVDGVTLVAKGAGVDVTVTADCNPWYQYALEFSAAQYTTTVTQRVGGGNIVSVSGSVTVPCDGTPHTTSTVLTATSLALKPGAALLQMNLGGYYTGSALPTVVTETVKL